MFFKNIISGFISEVVESKETDLHVLWKLLHCIGIPSDSGNKTSIPASIKLKGQGVYRNHQPVNSICKELKFIQCPINIINIINCCYQRNEFCQHSPAISKLRFKYKSHSPKEILHQSVPRKARFFWEACAPPPPTFVRPKRGDINIRI